MGIIRLRQRSAQVSLFIAKKPPMLDRPSFLALMVQPSAYENISWAISSGVLSA